jgi:hypothetical protein
LDLTEIVVNGTAYPIMSTDYKATGKAAVDGPPNAFLVAPV